MDDQGYESDNEVIVNGEQYVEHVIEYEDGSIGVYIGLRNGKFEKETYILIYFLDPHAHERQNRQWIDGKIQQKANFTFFQVV